MPLTIEYADPKHPEIISLLQQSHALMLSLYSAEENHFLSVDALCAPHIRFFGARSENYYKSSKTQPDAALILEKTLIS